MEELTKPKKPSKLDGLINRALKNTDTQVSTMHEQINSPAFSPDQTAVINGKIKCDLIDRSPYQPRLNFDPTAIINLAESMDSETKQIEPIIVRPKGERFELIAGERRLMAARRLEWDMIDAIVRTDVDDSVCALMALSENIDREDLSDYEIGKSVSKIQDLFPSKVELANHIGKNRTDLYRYLCYADLPRWIINRLDSNVKLINRNNAQELKRLINADEYSEELYQPHIENALNMIEAGVLTQTLFIAKVKRLVNDAINPRKKSKDSNIRAYAVNGTTIGSMTVDEKAMTIKIKAEALNDKLIEAIYMAVNERLNSEQAKS